MRVLIQYNGTLRKFVVVESSDRDGSLMFVIRREGNNTSCTNWSTRPGDQEPRQLNFEKPRPKNKRITIHQSGRVNYHDSGRKIFIEPLVITSRTTCLYGYRVPALEKLDLHVGAMNGEDVIFDLSDFQNSPFSFSVLIGP